MCPGKGQDHPTDAGTRVYLVAAKGVKGRSTGFTLHTLFHLSLFRALQILFLDSLYAREDKKMKQEWNLKVRSHLEVELGPGLVSLFPWFFLPG